MRFLKKIKIKQSECIRRFMQQGSRQTCFIYKLANSQQVQTLKVLILCHDFPPLNSIGAQRPASWVRYLPQEQCEVTVVTKNWSPEPDSQGLAFVINTEQVEQQNGATLYRVPDKETPSLRWSRRFYESRMAVVKRGFTFLEMFLKWLSPKFDKNHFIFLKADELLGKERYDVLLTTSEPFILMKYGNRLKEKHGVKWIADYRDGWFHNHVTKASKDIFIKSNRWFEYFFEKMLVAKSDRITVTDPLLAARFRKFHHPGVEVVYNGFDTYYTPGQINPAYDSRRLVLLHGGTLTRGQQVEFLLQAILDLSREKKIDYNDVKLVFLGLDIFPDQRQRVMQFHPDMPPFIETTKRFDRNQALQKFYEADILLTFTEKKHRTIFAKNFDYLSVGRPVWVVPGDESVLSNFIKDAGAGQSFYSSDELKQAILHAIALKRQGGRPGSVIVNRKHADFYTRKRQANVLAGIIRSVCLYN